MGAYDSGAAAARAKWEAARLRLNSTQKWRLAINSALMLLDASMYVVAGAVVLLLRHDPAELHSQRFGFAIGSVWYLVCCAVIWVIALHIAGIYHRHVMGDGYQVSALLIKAMFICWVAQCAFNFFCNFDLNLTSLCLVVIGGWLLTSVERLVARRIITRTREKGRYAYDTVLIGSVDGIANTLKFLGRRQQLNYRPIGVCPIRVSEDHAHILPVDDADGLSRLDAQSVQSWGSTLPVVRYDDHVLAEHISQLGAQTVMVCDEIPRYSESYNTFSVRMESLGLEIAMLASAADAAGHETQVRSIQGVTIITQRLAQYSLAAQACKRLFDIAVSVIAIVLSLLITVPVAIAIKLTDHGPIFYTQERIGLRGRPFRMIKFRSMVVNADELKAELAKRAGQENRFVFKMKDDPRITKVGHFIRRYSIDELPQFLNVFVGDMSVVGPRPPLPEEYARYNQVYATRMLVRPGITGPWQVSGRSDLSERESEALDVSYVQNWSVLGDVIYVLRTIGAVCSHKGAY